jgi:hypothetical protein
LFNIGFNWIPQYHLLIKQATSWILTILPLFNKT